jgi:hypothetical protein
MKKAALRLPMVLLVLLLLMGCATVQMTPEKTSIWMNSIYSFHYDQYLRQVLKPDLSSDILAEVKADPAKITPAMLRTDLTNTEKDVLRATKEVLVELHPLLLTYARYVKYGQVPPEELSARVVQLVTLLAKEI